MNTNNDALSWYVIQTNPRQEDRAYDNLKAWQVPVFFPKIKQRWQGRGGGGNTYVAKPLFPRYIFAKFDPQHYLHKIRFTRGVHNIVSFGDAPTPVDDEVIELIKQRMGEDGFVRMDDELTPGTKVLINDGPLKDLIGIFERETSEADRVMILLENITYQARIEIRRDYLAKVS